MANMNNQGKRPDQYDSSTKIAWYGVLGMVIVLLLVSLLTGCATTQETSKECCKSEKTSTK
jgi:hypothetical protein